MKILVACEESGTVREAFNALGHEAWSCDLVDTRVPGLHIVGDALELLDEDWDLVIAHPPCTYLANSGVRWLRRSEGFDPQRWALMYEAVAFFRAFLHGLDHVPCVCIENPIPHGHAGLPDYDQLIQPWQFGDPFSKATCLWLRGLPPLVPLLFEKPTDITHACHMEPPGPNRQRNRSKTYDGIANAMAKQWGTDWRPQLELVA